MKNGNMAREDQSLIALSPIEKEVVVLKAIKELVDSIVNFEVLALTDSDPAEVRFNSTTHSKFFNLVLVDLLSKIDEKGGVERAPYLTRLAAITEKPHFDVDGSVDELRTTTLRFRDWLNKKLKRERLWLPSIDVEMTLELSRYDLVKIGGNICRHNFLRAVRIAKDVRKILSNSGVNITLDQALLVLSDINEWLHGDMFQYHSSTIAEFLNDIRWGIYTYLRPEFSRSMVKEDGEPPRYYYTYPRGVESAFGAACYWDLMNEIRHEPHMRRFKVPQYLKKRY